ncbi:MAG: hypothetical protein IKS74_07140, partial [Methanomicrobium sp.]|nr:hypothetical protein [Methanomicrobium sp.]
MKYYRVKKGYEDKPTYIQKKKNGRTYWENGEPLYPNALFTPAEKAKMYPNVKDVAFEIVDIP